MTAPEKTQEKKKLSCEAAGQCILASWRLSKACATMIENYIQWWVEKFVSRSNYHYCYCLCCCCCCWREGDLWRVVFFCERMSFFILFPAVRSPAATYLLSGSSEVAAASVRWFGSHAPRFPRALGFRGRPDFSLSDCVHCRWSVWQIKFY